MNDKEKLDECISSLHAIYRMLNLRKKCSAREYTLDEDEMGCVFAARDVAQQALRTIKND